jgi:hypothetical protein
MRRVAQATPAVRRNANAILGSRQGTSAVGMALFQLSRRSVSKISPGILSGRRRIDRVVAARMVLDATNPDTRERRAFDS